VRVDELALSQAALARLRKADIRTVSQLAEHDLGELLDRPELTSGVELHELVCALHRHGLTLFSGHGGHIQTDRELEILRLRIVEGLTLAQIGARVRLNPERVRQLLKLHFRLRGSPPAVARSRQARNRTPPPDGT
jgi:DNA-binding CsgD family transcriptional regulator